MRTLSQCRRRHGSRITSTPDLPRREALRRLPVNAFENKQLSKAAVR
jgi:hypothetical protein